jgi:xanthine dehydrogenase molybdopterin-binding subunit B
MREDGNAKPTGRGLDTTHVIKGSYAMPAQYHFTMETQSCAVSHSDEGLLVRSSTQWMDAIQASVAQVVGIDQNKYAFLYLYL